MDLTEVNASVFVFLKSLIIFAKTAYGFIMKLTLKRRYKGKEYTIGDLYVNGKKFCETIEDTDRGLTSQMSESEIAGKKKHGVTAIPTGVYPVQMGIVSPKFKNKSWATPWGGKLPRLSNVKGFSGVLIHVGNSASDTEGCLLVGENKVKGQVINSTEVFNKLMVELVSAWYRDEYISIEVK